MNDRVPADSKPATRRDWLIAALIALITTAVLQVPYILGYVTTPDNLVFTGTLMNPEDSHTYFATMLEGRDGNWLYTLPFTPEKHDPAFVNVFYLALGHAARFFGFSLSLTWNLSRAIFGFVMFLAAFGFISAYLPASRERWTAYALAVFGSGLGWTLLLIGQTNWLGFFPVDFKMPEAHLFFSALTFPHVAAGTTMILASFWLTLRSFQRSSWKIALAAGIANLALTLIYPFLLYLIIATVGIYLIYRAISQRKLPWRDGMLAALSMLVPTPLVIYYAVTLKANPVFRIWEAQSITLSPPWPHYLLAYAPMLLLGLPVLYKRRAEFSFLGCWLLAVSILIYAPLNAQRRFVQGVQVPLAILAGAGFFEFVVPFVMRSGIVQRLLTRPRYSVAGLERLLTVSFLLVMGISNVYVLASMSVTAAVEKDFLLFRPKDEIDAAAWLQANTPRDAVVFGAYETGNFIPGWAGNHVVLGHWSATVDRDEKMKETAHFFDGQTSDAWRTEFLARYGVAYLFYGPQERSMGSFDPSRMQGLETVYRNGTVIIYKFVDW